MRATWWQRFWRWAVLLELIVLVVGTVLTSTLKAQYPSGGALLHTPPEQLLAASFLGLTTAIAAMVAFVTMIFTVPIWLVVELHGGLQRWRARRRGPALLYTPAREGRPANDQRQ